METIASFPTHAALLENKSALTGIDLLIVDASRCERLFDLVVEARKHAPCRILVLSAAVGDYMSHRALSSGATGIISECDTPDEWAAAIRTVVRGGVYQSPASVAARAAGPVVFGKLTPQESKILPLACRGLPDEEIGRQVGISALTAESHRSSVMRKLGVGDTGCLLVAGILMGVVSAGEINYSSRVRRSAGGRRRK